MAPLLVAATVSARAGGLRGRQPGKGRLHGQRVAELVQTLHAERLAGSRHGQRRTGAQGLAAGGLYHQARQHGRDDNALAGGHGEVAGAHDLQRNGVGAGLGKRGGRVVRRCGVVGIKVAVPPEGDVTDQM